MSDWAVVELEILAVTWQRHDRVKNPFPSFTFVMSTSSVHRDIVFWKHLKSTHVLKVVMNLYTFFCFTNKIFTELTVFKK